MEDIQRESATRAFLEYLFTLPPVSYPGTEKTQALKPNTNSHDGYPLIKSVHFRDTWLIHFLLAHKADPNKKNKAAVYVAIHQRDLKLVKILVEGGNKSTEGYSHKRRKKLDNVKVDSFLLAAAVKAKATDIVEWLVKEKGCVPDIRTLRSME